MSVIRTPPRLSAWRERVDQGAYGFYARMPAPMRDRFGERLYPIEQVDRLRLIRRLLSAGHRPGKIIGLPAEQLESMAAETAAHVAGVDEVE